MFNLDHISVKDFYILPEKEVDRYLEIEKILLVRDDRFNKHKSRSGSFTFGEVMTIKSNIQDPTFENVMEIFSIFFKVKRKEYLETDIVEYFYALKYIKKTLRILIETENKLLKTEKDELMEMAGVGRLKALGDLTTLFKLGREFSKSPMEIESWSYNIVLSILVEDKIRGEISKDYKELTKKSK